MNKRGYVNRRGQMQLSFGMIFSIILIIVFVGFAVYVIFNFIDVGDEAQIAKFSNSLQEDIDKVWKAEQSSQKEEYFLPDKIKAVCFVDNEFENLILESDEITKGKKINHIDIEKTLNGQNKLCVNVINGKISMILKKDFGENLVTIE